MTDTQSKARQYWQGQGKNFMTPDVIEYITTPRFLVELSEGTGFDHEPIYGVTVATLDGEPDHDRSQMFHSLDDAREFIEIELYWTEGEEE